MVEPSIKKKAEKACYSSQKGSALKMDLSQQTKWENPVTLLIGEEQKKRWNQSNWWCDTLRDIPYI